MLRFVICGMSCLFIAASASGDGGCGWAERGSGGAPREFESRTGADTYNYPRDPRVDYRHLKLTLRFDDFATKRFDGTAEYTIRAIAPKVRAIELDAVDFQDVAVMAGGAAADFSYDDRRLTIRFATDIPTETDTSIAIRYRVTDPESGMTFCPADPAHPRRPVSVHTQGQTETNRYWFPCHDSPNVRFTTEEIVTVPKPFTVLGNGKLIETRDEPDGKSRTFHYKQDVPHVAYLVSLAIADFDVQRADHNGIPVEYYVPKEWAADTARTFARTPEMIGLFEKLTGVKYPYAKYAQSVVPNFESGGMENISATTLVETCLIDERAALDDDADGLIAHELAHQWYGDLLTCRTWAHIWLNEGFATYLDEVWFEHWKGRDWYEVSFRQTYRGVAERDKPEVPGAMVYRDYSEEWQTFGNAGRSPYSKGSSVLAMLRHMLGDDVFWKGIQTYTSRFATKLVETEDFRKVMEEVSGRSLEQFFEQYCYRPGSPSITLTYRWDGEAKAVEIGFKQTQTINAKAPAFKVPIDLLFVWDDGQQAATFELTAREATFRQALPKEPTMVCVDPHAGLLAKLDVKLPRAMWIRMLDKGPSAVVRWDAATALGADDHASVVPALSAALMRADEFWMIRSAAATGLGKIEGPSARDALIAALEADKKHAEPRVRRAIANALGNYRYDEKVAAALMPLAKGDPSYAVEAAATAALGEIRVKSAADVVFANTTRPARYDRLTLAALDALVDLEDARGLDVCMRLAGPASAYRTRPQAIRQLPRIAKLGTDAQRAKVREFLERLLIDEEPASLRAAISALGALGDERAIPALEARRAAGHGRGRATRERLAEEISSAISAIRSKTAEPAATRAVREDVDKLRKRVKELEEKIEKLSPVRAATTQPSGSHATSRPAA